MKATKAINSINTLTPEERRELVERPFPIVTVGAQKSWKGSGTANTPGAYNFYMSRFNRNRAPDDEFAITRGGNYGRSTE